MWSLSRIKIKVFKNHLRISAKNSEIFSICSKTVRFYNITKQYYNPGLTLAPTLKKKLLCFIIRLIFNTGRITVVEI